MRFVGTLNHSIDLYNNLVDSPDSLTPDSVDNSCSSLTQKFLSNKIEHCQFRKLFDNSAPIDRARLLSISTPHASAWLSVTPSLSMGLHLEPSEFQVAIKWWLFIPVAQCQSCSQCNAALDAYGHHALCCKLGGDVVSRHNRLRDIFNDYCHFACLAPQLEMGGWSREYTRPADVLIPNWVLGKPAALAPKAKESNYGFSYLLQGAQYYDKYILKRIKLLIVAFTVLNQISTPRVNLDVSQVFFAVVVHVLYTH